MNDEEKKLIWTETLLRSVIKAETRVRMLDDSVEATALAGAMSRRASVKDFDEMERLFRKKRDIVRMLANVNSALLRLSELDRQIVCDSLIRNNSLSETGCEYNLKKTQLYTRRRTAVRKIAGYLENMGYTCGEVEKTFGGEQWMLAQKREIMRNSRSRSPSSRKVIC